MKTKYLILAAVCVTTAFQSCKKNKEDEDDDKTTDTDARAVYISNEGAFGQNNASISRYLPDDVKLTNNMFFQANGVSVGDTEQSFEVAGEKGVSVLTSSGKVEIMNLSDFVSTGTISGLSYPRFFKAADASTGYLSNGKFAGKLYKVNVSSASLIDSVSTGQGPENIAIKNGKIVVANSGGWDKDSTITVIDEVNFTVDTNLILDGRPTDVEFDADGNIWVFCKGWSSWDKPVAVPATLLKVSASDYSVLATIQLGEATGYSPNKIGISADGQYIYVIEDATGVEGIYKVGINESTLPATPIVSGTFNGIAVDPVNSDVYGLVSPSFSAAGTMNHYDKNGTLIYTGTVGIGPNGAAFKN